MCESLKNKSLFMINNYFIKKKIKGFATLIIIFEYLHTVFYNAGKKKQLNLCKFYFVFELQCFINTFSQCHICHCSPGIETLDIH